MKKPIIAISTGDPNGVGYEITIKTLANPHILEICTPVVFGNLRFWKEYKKCINEDIQQLHIQSDTPLRATGGEPVVISDVKAIKEGQINFINVYDDNVPFKPGESLPESGRAAYLSLSKACDALESGAADALLTAPINKENIQSDSFRFTGHTEYLTSRFAGGNDSLMMMVSEQMKVALVCNHVPLSKVASEVTEEHILKKLRVLSSTLTSDFLLRSPRIAVLALNPHAGDKGLLGDEEQTIITPAIQKAQAEGIEAYGPYTADGFFGSGSYTRFDAILAMYHDQGLIPFKSLDMSGVNYTAGLPIVRTSPDHGTAYDLAGKGTASADSMRNALYLAIDVLKRRAITKEINTSPLPIKEQQPERREPKEFKGFNPAEARREREERQAAALAAARGENAAQ
ncbi:MAG: 4-hydroxythreonine-4-phosphate dehydrogenase PdxA [Paludibacteraceae bacterium]|nr:4-hydroxythreonine-4-phosphate dehydrogenase PdxA [Paludibacteraceae bacterium]